MRVRNGLLCARGSKHSDLDLFIVGRSKKIEDPNRAGRYQPSQRKLKNYKLKHSRLLTCVVSCAHGSSGSSAIRILD